MINPLTAPKVWREHQKLPMLLGQEGVILEYSKEIALIEFKSPFKRGVHPLTTCSLGKKSKGAKIKLVLRQIQKSETGLILYGLKAKII